LPGYRGGPYQLQKALSKYIEAVCRNIARSWDGIVLPANFDKKRATYRS
jgi:hypothetical protein